ncbi:MAG: transcriptional regulator [Desulfobacterota bacterium]|nr:transcriptional regulator [Thermodesulfobacteriota bacterium]
MTIRKHIIELLAEGRWTARDLSQAVHVSEKEVIAHLEHVSKSMKHAFGIEPPRCLACGFSFKNRLHIRSPGRCPRCKSEHIQDPRFYRKNAHGER